MNIYLYIKILWVDELVDSLVGGWMDEGRKEGFNDDLVFKSLAFKDLTLIRM